MNDVITKMVASVVPINPISFNSVANEFILVGLVEFTVFGTIETSCLTLMGELSITDSLVIIEFRNLSLDLDLFFFEFFFAILSSTKKLTYF
tara:strand:+ start:3337 stop:3612 length:276 start_codon:yes stop_codon:yes gene_type:complete